MTSGETKAVLGEKMHFCGKFLSLSLALQINFYEGLITVKIKQEENQNSDKVSSALRSTFFLSTSWHVKDISMKAFFHFEELQCLKLRSLNCVPSGNGVRRAD